MPPKPSPHPLAGQSPRHGVSETDKLLQHHHHHAQGQAQMGRPRLSHARRSHSKAATLWRTLSGQTHSQRAKKTFQGQPEGLPERLKTSALSTGSHSPRTDPPDAISSSKEPTQQRSAGPFKLSENVKHARPEPPAPTAQRLPTSALPVGEASLSGLA